MQDAQEKQKLLVVNEEILRQINKNTEGLRTRKEGVVEARRLMYKATHVVRDFDDVALLAMYAQEISATEAAYGETSKELQRLKRIMDTPYFARIDFVESDEFYTGDTEEIYIGRHSLFDEATQSFHVYDWRAPISAMFYDYGVGDASFFVPVKDPRNPRGEVMNKIAGKITLKRQYQIERGALVYFFDSDLAVEDDILRKELSKAGDAKIKTIIHSIQREQNQAIRAEDDSVLVFGPAGSGKTSVGLHRLAYLLYRHRETLSSGRVRIFSPSAVFTSYIAGIIPELGEDDVVHMDFAELIEMHTHRVFKDAYELINFVQEKNVHPEGYAPRREWLTYKYSAAFLTHLEKTVTNHTPAFSEDVYFFRDKVCEAERLTALYADRTSTSTLAGKTNRVLAYVNQCFDEYYKENRKKITALYESIEEDDLSDEEARVKFEEERGIVIADLRGRLSPKPMKLYEKALKSFPAAVKASKKYLHESLRQQEALYFEDALALLYVSVLTGRITPDKTVKHILLDEAQDCCLFQHRILQKLYPASHFTVLADTNQALYSDLNLHSREEITALYPAARVIPLTTSYRNTYEISRFASRLLDEKMRGDSLYERHGEEPQVISTPHPVNTLCEIMGTLPAEYKTVGILTADVQNARVFHEALKKAAPEKGLPTVNLIADTMGCFVPGVMVVALPFAKGLEFDAVICPDYDKMDIKQRYLTCTRALHRLYLFSNADNQTHGA